jgi:ABC-type bacteriocin/lantibiotic exporter with double-glycine peptidase domain
MEAGKIIQSGKYNELVEGGGAFKHLVEAHGDAMGSSYQRDVEGDEQELELEVAKLEKSRSQGSMMLRNLSRARSRQVSQQEQESPAQLTQQEEREVGDQGWAVYIKYIRTAHGWVVFFMGIVTQTIFVVGQMAANYWMATRVSDQGTSDILLIGVYSGMSILSGIFVFLRSQYNVALGLKASKSFFTQLIMCLFHAPMAFFDSTPMGRILSRVWVFFWSLSHLFISLI